MRKVANEYLPIIKWKRNISVQWRKQDLNVYVVVLEFSIIHEIIVFIMFWEHKKRY